MGDKLDKQILETFGVDTGQLAAEHQSLLCRGIASEHESVIHALATAIAYGFVHDVPEIMLGAARLLFAVGYAAGEAEPDLSVFAGLLEDDKG